MKSNVYITHKPITYEIRSYGTSKQKTYIDIFQHHLVRTNPHKTMTDKQEKRTENGHLNILT